jgi:hypothetical protein
MTLPRNSIPQSRPTNDRRANACGIAEVDPIGDPSLLRDGVTERDGIALETYRDARAAMASIREAGEECAPPGSMPCEGYLTLEFTVEAQALVRGIYAIAGRVLPRRAPSPD